MISDWQGIDRITTPEHANYTFSIVAGMNTGIDMVLSSAPAFNTSVHCVCICVFVFVDI